MAIGYVIIFYNKYRKISKFRNHLRHLRFPCPELPEPAVQILRSKPNFEIPL